VNSDSVGTLIMLVLIVLAFWLLVMRPARKRQQEMQRIQRSLAVGSEVMLGSGIFGTVAGIGDDTVDVTVSPGTQLKVARQAVVRVIEQPATEPPAGGPGTEAPGTDTPGQQ
jgi:preprotein translocase subunit YajC